MGALYGLFRADPWSGVTYENGIPTQDNAKVANAIQRYVIEHSRLGIPVLLAEECPHGHQALDGTLLPVNTAIGSTWNPELNAPIAKWPPRSRRGLTSAWYRYWTFCRIAVGTLRGVLRGRPVPGARMTEAVVHGMQGREQEERKRPDKAAVLKHLCAQGAGQGGRNAGPVPVGERASRNSSASAGRDQGRSGRGHGGL